MEQQARKPALYWHGTVPAGCDCCGIGIHTEFIDGATIHGPWANLHPACHLRIGRGIGPGLGQRYQKQPDGRWMKVED